MHARARWWPWTGWGWQQREECSPLVVHRGGHGLLRARVYREPRRRWRVSLPRIHSCMCTPGRRTFAGVTAWQEKLQSGGDVRQYCEELRAFGCEVRNRRPDQRPLMSEHRSAVFVPQPVAVRRLPPVKMHATLMAARAAPPLPSSFQSALPAVVPISESDRPDRKSVV